MAEIMFVVDVGPDMGAGHLSRCAALAESFEFLGHNCTFMIPAKGERWIETIMPNHKNEIRLFEDGKINCLNLKNCDVLIMDGQCADWPENDAALKVQFFHPSVRDSDSQIDMLLAFPYHLQHYAKCTRMMSRSPMSMDGSWVPIRKSIADLRDCSLSNNQNGEMQKILVSFGISDEAKALSNAVIDELHGCFENVDIVVLGAKGPLTTDMGTMMSTCDLMIGRMGMTAWERCCLGIPAIVIPQPDELVSSEWFERWAAIIVSNVTDLRQHLESLSPGTIQRMSYNASRLCDGTGADNLARHILWTLK